MPRFNLFPVGILFLLLACQTPRRVAPVSPLPPSPLLLEPAEATLTTGQGAAFKVRAADGGRPTVVWEALGGGSVDGEGQYLAPGTPGTYVLQAKAFGDRVARASIRVVPPPRGPLSAPAHVRCGAQDQRASVPAQPGSTYAWTLQGGSLRGPSDGAAVAFDAGNGAQLTLGCRVVNAAGTARTFTLEIPLVSRVVLTIDPKRAVLTEGASRKFGFGLEGGSSGEVVWSVLEPGGGTVEGGRYRAPARSGEFTLQVASREDASVRDRATLKVVPAPRGPVRGPARIKARAEGLRASVPDQPGCAYAWTLKGGTIRGGARERTLVFDAGAGPRVRLQCEITNEAGDVFQASLDLAVAEP